MSQRELAPTETSRETLSHIGDSLRSGRVRSGYDTRGVAIDVRHVSAAYSSTPLRQGRLVSKRDFSAALQARYRATMLDVATNGLSDSDPKASAERLMTRAQWRIAIFGIVLLIVAFANTPLSTVIAINALATCFFLAAIFFRIYLAFIAHDVPMRNDAVLETPLDDQELPMVTILLPLFQEADGVAALVSSLGELDYPDEKLDIKLILEENDVETQTAVDALDLPDHFDIIIVPKSHPQTKPKACNYALCLARGELTVIYDAEDIPDRDQLKKAAFAFAAAPANVICMQARLNYYNRHENWLTRLFSLEYALWFDSLLPALQKLNAPIPLGGTSNIFRTEKLREIGGWDPYNVTEDADLGLRIARHGYRTALIDSTTMEEATCTRKDWLRQRSRWMKGYMQTWLVNVRFRGGLSGEGGWRGLFSTHLLLAGTIISALINPLLWGVFVWWLVTRSDVIGVFFPGPLLALNVIALLFGNAAFIYLAMSAPLKRGWPELAPAAILTPLYWWLTSLAAYKAVGQLITRPTFWEKTPHGVSPAARARQAEAQARIRATQ